MTRVNPLTAAIPLVSAVTLAALAPGCGAQAPKNTGADSVAAINYELVSVRDGNMAWCSEATVDQVLTEQMDKFGMMGCSAGVAVGDDVVYLTAQGIMVEDDPDTFVENDNIPYQVDTLQPVGSLSKTLTALGVMRLVELGYISVDDTVEQHLGSAVWKHPVWLQGATVHELLTHTSGIVELDARIQRVAGSAASEVNVFGGDYELIDWISYGLPDDNTNGGDPILAQVVMEFPENTTSTESYGNPGYLLLGAIIESVVTADDFGGFDSYLYSDVDFEPSWESWVWWVMAGEGTLRDANLYSTVVRSPWRQLSDDYPNLARGYDGTYIGGVGTVGDEIGWGQFQDDYGWMQPAGGFMMTIGDLTRLARQVGQEDTIFDDLSYWDTIKSNYSGARGIWYGYGVYNIGGPIGHGGTVDGFTAGAFSEGDLSVAWMCNTTPLDAQGNHVAVHNGFTNAFFDELEDHTLDVQCDDVVQPDGSYEARDVLTAYWFDGEYDALQTAASRYGLEQALSLAERTIGTDNTGAMALRYFEAGDYDAAAECALSYLGDTRDRWSCGR